MIDHLESKQGPWNRTMVTWLSHKYDRNPAANPIFKLARCDRSSHLDGFELVYHGDYFLFVRYGDAYLLMENTPAEQSLLWTSFLDP